MLFTQTKQGCHGKVTTAVIALFKTSLQPKKIATLVEQHSKA